MKDHEVRELVNKLRDVALEFHGAQQLRSRIQEVVRESLATARIWTKVEAIRAKQAAKPKHSPLPQALPPDSGSDAAQFQAGVREGYERAAKALGERAAGWRRHGDHHLEEEVLQCRSMLHDQKPLASASASAGPAKAGVA